MKDFMEIGKNVVKTILVVTIIKATGIGLAVMANQVLDQTKRS